MTTRVLLTDVDVYGKVGGGQSVYRSLIASNLGIDFYYVATNSEPVGDRPANAHPIQYRETYLRRVFAKYHDVTPPRWAYDPFLRASNIASSVAGRSFDVVEVADYEQYGTFLRPALAHHGVQHDRVVLALHGRISTTIRMNWMTEGETNRALETQEEMQYRAVDARYGISKMYIDDWRGSSGIEASYISPLRIMDPPSPTEADASGLPSLNFIGRTEKRKGPDIFVDLAWWLPPGTYSTANVIGPDSYDPNGIGSGYYLYTMAQNRGKNITFYPSMGRSDLVELFASRALTILPSRYDSFNLVALESLFAGCPVAVGSGAGVVRFLKESYPDLPFIVIDMKNVYGCLPEIVSALEHYDDYRGRLVRALREAQPYVEGVCLGDVYEKAPIFDADVRDQLERWYGQLIRFYQKAERDPIRRAKATAIATAKSWTTPAMRRQLYKLRSDLRPPRLRAAIRERFIKSPWKRDAQVADQVLRARHLHERYRHLFYLPEQSDADLRRKLQTCWDIAADVKIDRVRTWREIARLERLQGHELLAAMYELRSMRALGDDQHGDLPRVAHTLEKHGMARESRAARAMYGAGDNRDSACAALLEEARTANSANRRADYEFIDDRRGNVAPRVSIIVSLYNAAAKLPFFVRSLSNQTLIQSRAAEIILIDSGSPGPDYAVFREIADVMPLPFVYARSQSRETIQSAWNRGIALARAPYLAFLGVDEALLPNCLQVLAGELDADAGLDWVQANSLVTAVDEHGVWMHDIMPYDRTGYRQDLTYLETCYLSWVGALYRRSIHDRFGYYDATFGAAGDTEFKNRVLPFIRTKAIPVTLGLFWNFPEERTTLSPRAEIEDLRAWYVHRTLAGVRYAMRRGSQQDVEALVSAALRYRKSYTHHWSTDVEYASNVLAFLGELSPGSKFRQCAAGNERLLHAYRWLDYLQPAPTRTPMLAPVRVYNAFTEVEKHQRSLRIPELDPAYHVFNDNRYEQHAYVWRSDD